MTRNDKLRELLNDKWRTGNTVDILGDDIHIKGVVDIVYNTTDKVVIYVKYIGYIQIPFKAITTVI